MFLSHLWESCQKLSHFHRSIGSSFSNTFLLVHHASAQLCWRRINSIKVSLRNGALVLKLIWISINHPLCVARKMRGKKTAVFFSLLVVLSYWNPVRNTLSPPPALQSLDPISSEPRGPLIIHARSLSHWPVSLQIQLPLHERWCNVPEPHGYHGFNILGNNLAMLSSLLDENKHTSLSCLHTIYEASWLSVILTQLREIRCYWYWLIRIWVFPPTAII